MRLSDRRRWRFQDVAQRGKDALRVDDHLTEILGRVVYKFSLRPYRLRLSELQLSNIALSFLFYGTLFPDVP